MKIYPFCWEIKLDENGSVSRRVIAESVRIRQSSGEAELLIGPYKKLTIVEVVGFHLGMDDKGEYIIHWADQKPKSCKMWVDFETEKIIYIVDLALLTQEEAIKIYDAVQKTSPQNE